MTLVAPKVEVFFDQVGTGGDFLTLDDPVKGQLDDVLYPLFDAQPLDITGSVYDVSITRGRLRELDEIAAGTCSVKLRNYDGRFLPTELNDARLFDDLGVPLTDDGGELLLTDSGVYGFGNILPGKRVRVSVGMTPIFDGIIDDWSYSFEKTGKVDAAFVAADALATLARTSFDAWTATASQTAGPRLAAILDRNEVLFPANRSLDDGSTTLQGDSVSAGTNVLQYAQTVARSELGRLFAASDGVLTFRGRHSLVAAGIAATFADDGTGIGFSGVEVSTSSLLLSNRVTVDREGGTAQTSENLTSQAKYGVRSLDLRGLLLETDIQSSDMADFLAGIYSEPQTRIAALTVYIDNLDDSDRTTVVDLDLADVVSVTWTPTGGSGPVTQLSVVEGVSHQTGIGSLHVVTLKLSPVASTEAFVLDDVALGLLDVGVLTY